MSDLQFEALAALVSGARPDWLEPYFVRLVWLYLAEDDINAARAVIAQCEAASLALPASTGQAVAAFAENNRQGIDKAIESTADFSDTLPMALDARLNWQRRRGALIAAAYRSITLAHLGQLGLDAEELGWPVKDNVAYPIKEELDDHKELLVKAAAVLSAEQKKSNEKEM